MLLLWVKLLLYFGFLSVTVSVFLIYIDTDIASDNGDGDLGNRLSLCV